MVECPNLELISYLVRPFIFFCTAPSKPNITITIHEGDFDYRGISAVSRFSTPRNIVFVSKDFKIIDYFGKGTILESNDKLSYRMYGNDKNFLAEAFYLLVISAFARFCDKKGYLRIHSLGIVSQEMAYLFLMPPGFGKSTLALNLLKESEYTILADDCPIYARGTLLPFPVRIGVLDKKAIAHIPEEFIYRIDRMEFGTKYFIDMKFWKDKIPKKPLRKIVLVRSRITLGKSAQIQKISRIAMFMSLLRDAVIGIGLYQGMEFIFSAGSFEVFLRIPVFIRRLTCAVRLLFRSTSYEITLTRDQAENVAVIKKFTSGISENPSRWNRYKEKIARNSVR